MKAILLYRIGVSFTFSEPRTSRIRAPLIENVCRESDLQPMQKLACGSWIHIMCRTPFSY